MIPEASSRGSKAQARRITPPGAVVVILFLALLAPLGGCRQAPLFAPSGATITLSSSSLILPVNGTAQISATVVESGGSAVQNGTTVTFTTTLGSFVSNTATTNSGRATVTFNAGTQSGTATITAFSGSVGSSSGSGGTGTSTLTLTIGAASVSSVVVSASPANVSQLGNLPSTITATVLDTNNNGVPGVSVQFSTDQGALTVVSATTNAAGQATTTLTTSQAATVTATVGGKTGTARVSVFSAPTITITPPSSPTALVAANFLLNITPGTGAAAITDVTVNFGDGSAGALVDLGAVSGSVNVAHAYATPNQYTVAVTVKDGSGQTVSASTPVTIYAAIPFTLTVAAAPSTAVAGTTLVIFTATPNAGAPAITSYLWNFGDGSAPVSKTEPSVSYTYLSVPNGQPSQQLLVTVTATGADGRVGYGSVAVTVTK